MIDLHSHILPNLDDGSHSLNESIEMCRLAEADGITIIVATPHFKEGIFINDPCLINTKLIELKRHLKNNNIQLSILAGAEISLTYDFDLFFKNVVEQKLMRINESTNYLLVELPEFFNVLNVKNLFFRLKLCNITPIVAHPERNDTILRDPFVLKELLLVGSLLQITADSLLGKSGKKVTKLSINMLKNNMVHIIASDSHNSNYRTPHLSSAVKVASKIIGKSQALKLVTEFPLSIINNSPIIENGY